MIISQGMQDFSQVIFIIIDKYRPKCLFKYYQNNVIARLFKYCTLIFYGTGKLVLKYHTVNLDYSESIQIKSFISSSLRR